MKTSIFLLVLLIAFIAGCGDSGKNSSIVGIENSSNEGDMTSSWTMKLKITQTAGMSNFVLVNDSFTTSSIGVPSSFVNFSTLATENGNSTFTIEYGAYWIGSGSNTRVNHLIEKTSSPSSTPYSLLTLCTPIPNGSFNTTINNANLLEHKNYRYKFAVLTNDDDDN
jgi:hypothetical protein